MECSTAVTPRCPRCFVLFTEDTESAVSPRVRAWSARLFCDKCLCACGVSAAECVEQSAFLCFAPRLIALHFMFDCHLWNEPHSVFSLFWDFAGRIHSNHTLYSRNHCTIHSDHTLTTLFPSEWRNCCPLCLYAIGCTALTALTVLTVLTVPVSVEWTWCKVHVDISR